MREVASRLSSPSPVAEPLSESSNVVPVPVLAAGADPSALDVAEPPLADSLLLDRRLVGGSARGIFACEVGANAMGHLRGVAEPGDLVVFERPARRSSGRICAVRRASGVVLSRVLLKDQTLLLLPGEGESGFEAIDVPDDAALARALAGSHVLLIRR
jgi:SOS-response transcriptional repressor LexA